MRAMIPSVNASQMGSVAGSPSTSAPMARNWAMVAAFETAETVRAILRELRAADPASPG